MILQRLSICKTFWLFVLTKLYFLPIQVSRSLERVISKFMLKSISFYRSVERQIETFRNVWRYVYPSLREPPSRWISVYHIWCRSHAHDRCQVSSVRKVKFGCHSDLIHVQCYSNSLWNRGSLQKQIGAGLFRQIKRAASWHVQEIRSIISSWWKSLI